MKGTGRVRIRASYNADAMFLSRLLVAIEADTAHTLEWRQAVIGALRTLIALFLEHAEEKS